MVHHTVSTSVLRQCRKSSNPPEAADHEDGNLGSENWLCGLVVERHVVIAACVTTGQPLPASCFLPPAFRVWLRVGHSSEKACKLLQPGCVAARHGRGHLHSVFNVCDMQEVVSCAQVAATRSLVTLNGRSRICLFWTACFMGERMAALLRKTPRASSDADMFCS